MSSEKWASAMLTLKKVSFQTNDSSLSGLTALYVEGGAKMEVPFSLFSYTYRTELTEKVIA